ncbi:hypothetical protein NECAME_16566 [Necator americanus]|uniref:Uncharacterized protein n=1 Tax=Necator americanus TaxID=51031 RepID=W2TW83_NECAM|nr:hypothetical protein NECAME_16566 [Necator americanus]ETN85939.1 hypothetical protein NECAME_16566 [Necator americanus]
MKHGEACLSMKEYEEPFGVWNRYLEMSTNCSCSAVGMEEREVWQQMAEDLAAEAVRRRCGDNVSKFCLDALPTWSHLQHRQ